MVIGGQLVEALVILSAYWISPISVFFLLFICVGWVGFVTCPHFDLVGEINYFIWTTATPCPGPSIKSAEQQFLVSCIEQVVVPSHHWYVRHIWNCLLHTSSTGFILLLRFLCSVKAFFVDWKNRIVDDYLLPGAVLIEAPISLTASDFITSRRPLSAANSWVVKQWPGYIIVNKLSLVE